MTEIRPQPTSKTTMKWSDSLGLLGEERRRDLAQRLWAWVPEMATRDKPGPFSYEKLTGLDLYWLAACSSAGSGASDIEILQVAQSIREQAAKKANGDSIFSYPYKLDFLVGVDLSNAHLEGVDLSNAHLERARLDNAHLEGADLSSAHLEGACLSNAHLEGAMLFDVYLNQADLRWAHLEGAKLYRAHLEWAYLSYAHLERADLSNAHLVGSNMLQSSLDKETNLDGAILTYVLFDRAIFDSTNLSVVDWSLVPLLQDELLANQSHFPSYDGYPSLDLYRIPLRLPELIADQSHFPKFGGFTNEQGSRKDGAERQKEYQAAARAYRRLAVALQANGMSEEAASYAYRAQVMQQRVYWFGGPKAWSRWIFSVLLDGVAGYGYKPERSILWYLVTILGFAAAYFGVTHNVALFGLGEPSHTQPLQWYEAIVLSLASFHGRGFFPSGISLGDPVAILAAVEAVVGLFIEISFIATFTQRFFGSK